MNRWILGLVVAGVACSDPDEGRVSWEGDEPFVAEDAGRIPLTTPGTATRIERPVLELPLPPLEEVPVPVPEDPYEVTPPEPPVPETLPQPRRSATPPRQPAQIDSPAVAPRPTPTPVTPSAPPATPPPVPAPVPSPTPKGDSEPDSPPADPSRGGS